MLALALVGHKTYGGDATRSAIVMKTAERGYSTYEKEPPRQKPFMLRQPC